MRKVMTESIVAHHMLSSADLAQGTSHVHGEMPQLKT